MEEEKKELFEQFKNDPKVLEAIRKTGLPDDPEGSVSKLAGLAEELGYALSKEDIFEAFSTAEEQRKARTEKALEEIELLSDDALAHAAGGGDKPGCMDTYQDQENCWKTDGCDRHYNMYPGYQCHCNEQGGKNPECGGMESAVYCQTLFLPECPDLAWMLIG